MSVQRKKIVINASTVKISGGLIVAQSYLEVLCSDKRYDIFLICPKLPEYDGFNSTTCKITHVPDVLLRWVFRWFHDLLWLPFLIKSFKPDLVITLNNIPAITRVEQIFMHDNPYLTHGFIGRVNMSVKRKVVHFLRGRLTTHRLKYVKEVWVQSEYEQRKFMDRISFSGNVQVLTPMIPNHLLQKPKKRIMLPPKGEGYIRLICLSNYFEHKNIECLFDVIQLAQRSQFKLQIVFTLDPNAGNKCNKQIELVNRMSEDYAINIGHIPARQVNHVLSQCDGVILPSLMETFGLNCLDAWLNERPYFISDLPYARKICGESAIFIPPDSASGIVQTIKDSFDDGRIVSEAVKSGTKKIKRWPGQQMLLTGVERVLGS